MSQQLLFLFLGLGLGLAIFFTYNRFFNRSGLSVPETNQRFSPADAERLLKSADYEILAKQQKEAVITIIDGKEHYGNIEADYTVEKEGKKFAVIVHSGETSSDPNEPLFRRRLLEYDRAFRRYKLLVLDLNKGEIHQVAFRFPHEFTLDTFFLFVIALLIIAGILGILWVLATLKII